MLSNCIFRSSRGLHINSLRSSIKTLASWTPSSIPHSGNNRGLIFRCRPLISSPITANPSISSAILSRSLVYSSNLPPVEIPDVDLYSFVKESYLRHPEDKLFINGITLESWTARRLILAAERVAGVLQRLGFKQGDSLLIFATNCPEYAVVCLAALSLGGVVSPANTSYVPLQLQSQIEVSKASILVFTSNLTTTATKVFRDSDQLKDLLVIDGDAGKDFASLKEHMVDSANAESSKLVAPKLDAANATAFLPFSSGTTGLPKGVILTHRNIVANQVHQLHDDFKSARPGECVLGLLPFYHLYGLSVILINLTLHRACVVTLPEFTPESFLGAIQRHRIGVLYIVPPLVIFLTKHPLVDNFDISSVRVVFCGAAALAEETEAALRSRCGLEDLRQGYGLTETSPTLTMTPRWPEMQRAGSSGVLLQNTEARIVNAETGEDLEREAQGEIWVRGPQVMKGYLNNEEATAACLVDGWFRTGDLGYFTKDGHLYVTGRLKELIKYKGHQVPPAELEAVLLTHPEIADAAVIGVSASEEVGELPKAFVVLKGGAEGVGEAELHRFVDERVSPQMRLRGGIEFVEGIPKTPSGKILRRELS